MPASVHRRTCGQCGLGSPATQLMRAVRLPPPGGGRGWGSGWRARVGRQRVGPFRVEFAPSCRRAPGRLRVVGQRGFRAGSSRRFRAYARRTEAVGCSPRPSRSMIAAESRGAAVGVLERLAPRAARSHRRAACVLVELVDGAAAAGPKGPPALRFGGVSGACVVERRPVYQSRWFWRGLCRAAKPNERMQLTWLIGAPSQGRPRFTDESSGDAVSVHPPRS